MKHIAVDVGNSSIKAGVPGPAPGSWDKVYRWSQPKDFSLPSDDPVGWLISSVNRPKYRQFVHWIETHRKQDRVHHLDWTYATIKIQVAAPQFVGMDRLCAAVAGHAIVGQKPCIVIDAGTAVTVDAVAAEGAFLGGNIFVGLRGALDQLAQTTDALPRLETPTTPDDIEAFGKSTAQAIQSGVVLSIVGGISEIVRRMQQVFGGSAQVILTGGTAPLMKHFLTFETNLVENLVLDGVLMIGNRLAKAYE